MKKYLVGILFLIFSCDTVGNLDDETYDGNGAISCKINGRYLKPSSLAHVDCEFDNDGSNDYIHVGFYNLHNEFESVRFILYGLSPEDIYVGQVILLEDESNTGKFGQYVIENLENPYNTNSIQTGEVKILHFNYEEKIFAGTFKFQAKNNSGELVTITDGKFDLDID